MNALDVIANVMALYNSETQDIDSIVDAHYHPDAVFSDPIVKVHGRDNIAAQFRVLPYVFQSCGTSVLHRSIAGTRILTVDSVLSATFKFLPKYFGCSFRMFTVLEVKDVKIVQHTDFWDVQSVVENVPVISSVYPKMRRVLGYSSTKVVKILSPRPLPAMPAELLQLEESKTDDSAAAV
ncbi:hypothetical protein H310_01527 [Aphanomyces invadans]|uniref:SnoaL-like domain-containing protein n=1 Tax=Aphanomyces invadans TaxID=157072 RepID=A0A024UT22_9STRA|nr:hypothetical protein H310_01527 [Aphanomyces invadans]ETW09067.1 hypothetical protein H310_01527 [Aphanomyces invadans]|eukprot:XP_008862872.1 hypothetical protein H310_01527 [Aphanomyces invadans]